MTMFNFVRWALARVSFYRPAAGDVIFDRCNGRHVTVEAADARRVRVAFFVGDELRRALLLRRCIAFVGRSPGGGRGQSQG